MRRRKYLTAATAALSGMAGCTDVFDGTENESDADSEEYTTWIPVGNEISTSVRADAPAKLIDVDDYSLHGSVGERVAGIDATELERRVEIGPYTALSGDTTADEISEELGLDGDGSYGGYERFTDDQGRDFAVRDGRAVLQTFGSDGDEELFEAIVDARERNGERLAEANDEFGRLADAITVDDRVDIGFTPDVDPWSGVGIGYDVAAGRSAFDGLIAFIDEATAAELTTDATGDRIEVVFGVDIVEIETSRSGRVVTATGDVVTESI
jgi:hypothetical protein